MKIFITSNFGDYDICVFTWNPGDKNIICTFKLVANKHPFQSTFTMTSIVQSYYCRLALNQCLTSQPFPVLTITCYTIIYTIQVYIPIQQILFFYTIVKCSPIITIIHFQFCQGFPKFIKSCS